MRYKRNWAWECTADVYFKDGSSLNVDVQTDNKGRLNWIKLGGVHREVNAEMLKRFEIQSIHFTTPARVEVD